MIYELRTYTLRAGTLGDVVKAASTVSREIRKDDYGKLEGYWMTEIGPLNQIMHLWSYRDLNERTRLRAELGKIPRWTSEYIPSFLPNLMRQDIRLLNAIKPPVAPANSPNIYELRTYRAKPGAAKEWLQLFTSALEHREKYSKIVGLWQTDGRPTQRDLPHLGLYRSQCPGSRSRCSRKGSRLASLPWQERTPARGDAFHHHAADAAFPVAVAAVRG